MEKGLFLIFFNIFINLFINWTICILIDITPNVNNTRDIHTPLKGDVNLEVSFKEPTQNTITVIIYTDTNGGMTVGKHFDIQLMSTDY